MIALTIRDGESVSSELVRLGHSPTQTCDTTMDRTHQETLPRNLTLHIGNEPSLLERVNCEGRQTELVLAPVELHRRNIQRRLRESRMPQDGVEFADPAGVCRNLLDTAGVPTMTIDRIDRLSMIRSVLSDDSGSITSPAVPADPMVIEQIRSEVETVTGFHPERVDGFRDVASNLAAPMDADSTEIMNAAICIEEELRQRTSKSTSDVELIRHATRNILRTEGDIWTDTFGDVDTVSLVGVSSVSAAQIDLLHAVLDSVSVPIHVHFRRGTGTFLSNRVPQLFDVVEPGAVVF